MRIVSSNNFAPRLKWGEEHTNSLIQILPEMKMRTMILANSFLATNNNEENIDKHTIRTYKIASAWSTFTSCMFFSCGYCCCCEVVRYWQLLQSLNRACIQESPLMSFLLLFLTFARWCWVGWLQVEKEVFLFHHCLKLFLFVYISAHYLYSFQDSLYELPAFIILWMNERKKENLK